MVDINQKSRDIKKQCELLSISRNVYYYKPKVSEFKLLLMQHIDELYTENPSAGQRSPQSSFLRRFGIKVGVRLFLGMMNIMEIASLPPKPFLFAQNALHNKHSYILPTFIVTHVIYVAMN